MSDRTIAYALREDEVDFEAVRAQGAGGQNVNKVSSAAQLRFDIRASSLPDALKARLLALRDRRVSADGVVTIKAQRHRSLEMNRADALARLRALLDAAARLPRERRATQPTRAARRERVERKVQRGRIKALRGRVRE
jgi:ribosome-associated protein